LGRPDQNQQHELVPTVLKFAVPAVNYSPLCTAAIADPSTYSCAIKLMPEAAETAASSDGGWIAIMRELLACARSI
jgi:hypothetical protein